MERVFGEALPPKMGWSFKGTKETFHVSKIQLKEFGTDNKVPDCQGVKICDRSKAIPKQNVGQGTAPVLAGNLPASDARQKVCLLQGSPWPLSRQEGCQEDSALSHLSHTANATWARGCTENASLT